MRSCLMVSVCSVLLLCSACTSSSTSGSNRTALDEKGGTPVRGTGMQGGPAMSGNMQGGPPPMSDMKMKGMMPAGATGMPKMAPPPQ